MTRGSIGGPLGLEALAALAGAHQVDRSRRQLPPDRDTARAAAVEMRGRGLTVRDIAAALRLSADAVRDLLGEPSPNRR